MRFLFQYCTECEKKGFFLAYVWISPETKFPDNSSKNKKNKKAQCGGRVETPKSFALRTAGS